MGVDDLVDLDRDSDCLTQCDDYFLLVVNVLVGQHSARPRILATLCLAILEPLVADLVAADVEVSDFFGHIVEIE